jgi:hypothetical protein
MWNISKGSCVRMHACTCINEWEAIEPTLEISLVMAYSSLAAKVVKDSLEAKVGDLHHPSAVHYALRDGHVAVKLYRRFVKVVQALQLTIVM